MARIRSIKPEVRTSLVVASWPRDVRLLWVYLWGYLDDYGRGVDDARLVKADCFPLDDDVTSAVVDDWLDMIARSGPLCRYQLGGRRFMHAHHWDEHQRPAHPTRSRVPPCPIHEVPETLANDSGTSREILAPEQGAGSREQGMDARVVVAEQLPPPRTCMKHPNGTQSRCGACGEARRRSDTWQAGRAAQQRAGPRCPHHRGEPADNCARCRSEAVGVEPSTVVNLATRRAAPT